MNGPSPYAPITLNRFPNEGAAPPHAMCPRCTYRSIPIAVLCVELMGKGVSALQEGGRLPVTRLPASSAWKSSASTRPSRASQRKPPWRRCC